MWGRVTALALVVSALVASPIDPEFTKDGHRLDVERDMRYLQHEMNQIVTPKPTHLRGVDTTAAASKEAAVSSASAALEESNLAQTGWATGLEDGEPSRKTTMVIDKHSGVINKISDRLEFEIVDSVAHHDQINALTSSKSATLQSMLLPSENALTERSLARRMCEQESVALSKLQMEITDSVERAEELAVTRTAQQKRYGGITKDIHDLTTANLKKLNEIKALLTAELGIERDDAGGLHFDPVALRLRTPEEMLAQSTSMIGDVSQNTIAKEAAQDATLKVIARAFDCPKCDASTVQLKGLKNKTIEDHATSSAACISLAESHRPSDEADRESAITLRRDLGDLEAARRLRESMGTELEALRRTGIHTGAKLKGFFEFLRTGAEFPSST